MNFFNQDHMGLPVLIEVNNDEKHYFIQQKQHINHFGLLDECWRQNPRIEYQRDLTCFDAISIPQHRTLHVFACESENKIYHTRIENGNIAHEMLCQEIERKILGLSCSSKGDNLYLMCLITSEVRNMWWLYLFYLLRTERGWQGPLVLDFGYGSPKACGYLRSDLLNNNFVIYLLQEGDTCRPVYRSLGQQSEEAGATIYLQKEKLNASLPSVLVASDNSLHASWFSYKDDALFLNYARKNPSGPWEPGLNKEIPCPTSPFISLSERNGSLLMIWENNQTVFPLLSETNGKTWNALTPKTLDTVPNTVRFRSNFTATDKKMFYGSTIHCLGIPPHVFQGPEHMVKEIRKNPVSREVSHINALTSKMMAYSQRIQNNNLQLKNLVEEKQEEINRMNTFFDAKNDYVRRQVDVHKIELQNIQNTLIKSLKNLQEKLEKQKKDFLTGQELAHKKIASLEKENTRLSKALSRQTEGMMKLERELAGLKKEKHEKKSSLFRRLFRKPDP